MAAKNLRQFEFKLGKLGVLLFIVGLAVLVFAGFLFGVQVGRNIDTYPDMIARGMPARILGGLGLSMPTAKPEISVSAATAEQADPAPAADGQAGKEPAGGNAAAVMTPPSAAPVPEEGKKEVVPQPSKSTPAVAAVAPPPTPQSSATPPRAVSEAGTKEPAKPTAAKKEKVPPEEKKEKASEGNGKYSIQVVSFREKEKADGLSRKIKDLGYAPKVAMVDVAGKGQWYRVTINSFATKPAAEKAADELTKKIKGVSCVVKAK